MNRLHGISLALIAMIGMLATAAAQQTAGQASDEELKQNFAAEHEIGRRFQIDPNDLPAPKTGPIATNRSLIVPYSGQAPSVPPGFTATPFATGLANPRRLLVLPNGDVLVAEQRRRLSDAAARRRAGRAKWIDRHVEDLNRPYGLAWQRRHLLVADQDGIWRVPHVVGALRAGRPVPPQRVDQVPPDQRKPVAGAYGAEMLTKKGVFGIVAGPPEPPSGDRSEDRRAVCRRRLVGQSRRRARAEGDDPALRCRRLEPDDLRVRHAQRDRARLPSADRRAVGRWCRSATGSATICRPII